VDKYVNETMNEVLQRMIPLLIAIILIMAITVAVGDFNNVGRPGLAVVNDGKTNILITHEINNETF
jgi:hypothetical protein